MLPKVEMRVSSSEIAAVDLFCGAAGLSYGLRESGIKILAGIDIDPACQFPFEENVRAKFIEADICSVSPTLIKSLFKNTRIKVLAGCAPCQPFSGYTTKRRSQDQRWQLLFEFLRIAKAVKPEIITLENVPRLIHLPIWNDFVESLKAVGYWVAWKVVDASHYGVPQARKRLVLLASTLGEIEIPAPSKGSPRTVRSVISKLPSIKAGVLSKKDALHSARALTPKNLRRIQASRPAGTWREWPRQLRVKCHTNAAGKTYPSVYGRMSWDKPAPTITTQFYGFGNGRFGHPEQDRAITLREGALLQSFPLDFKFMRKDQRLNFREIGRLIGNAVPPVLAREIGKAIRDHVAGNAATTATAGRGISL